MVKIRKEKQKPWQLIFNCLQEVHVYKSRRIKQHAPFWYIPNCYFKRGLWLSFWACVQSFWVMSIKYVQFNLIFQMGFLYLVNAWQKLTS